MEKIFKIVVTEDGQKWQRLVSESEFQKYLKKANKKEAFDYYIKQSFLNGKCYLPGCTLPTKSEENFGRYLSKYERYYDYYFSENLKLEEKLSDKVRQCYENGKGSEISSDNFFSVASSSRFTVASFTENKNGKLDLISKIKIGDETKEIEQIELEKDTPVENVNVGIAPQLDAFIKTKDGDTYFVEVKCHEIFDPHKIELKWKYADNEILKLAYNRDKQFKKTTIKKKNKDEDFISIDGRMLQASDFGCDIKTTHFDFKQFLCHFMEICTYKKQNPNEKIHFRYLFYKNNEYIDKVDNKIYEELEEEIKIIFTRFSALLPEIDFGYCYNDEFNTIKSLTNEFRGK